MLRSWRDRHFRQFGERPGLVAVLMKRRNRQPWTPEDRAFLARELRRLARWLPGLILFSLPGGLLLLPAYAWLLDRRRADRVAVSGRAS